MKYAHEVIELMSSYPGKAFRMSNLIRYAGADARSRAARKAMSRVLHALADAGSIDVTASDARGGFHLYAWKVRHEVSKKACKVIPEVRQ